MKEYSFKQALEKARGEKEPLKAFETLAKASGKRESLSQVVKHMFSVLQEQGCDKQVLEQQVTKYLSHNYQACPKLDLVLFFPSLENEGKLLRVLATA